MKNDDDNFSDWIISLLIIFGGLWLLKKILSQPINQPGIFGFKFVRDLIPYSDRNGNEIFKNDFKNFDNKELTIIIGNMIYTGRQKENLSMPFYKTFTGTRITGEFRTGQFRILVYKLNENDFLLLSVFKKKTNETPKSEIEKAERRLKEYINR